KFAGITLRGGKRQRRICGIDVDRGNVQLEARMRLLQIKAADPRHVADEWNQLELNVDPLAPLSLAENECLVLHRKLCHRLERIDGDCEGLKRGRRSFAKRVVRPDQLCGYL